MPELEAVFRDNNTKSVKGWRHPLVPNTPVKIGRLPTESDWWMPDGLISSWHATVKWEGDKLQVEERPEPRPVNRIFYKRQPVSRFTIVPGESFVIGNTIFTLHDRAIPSSSDIADAAAPAEATFSRDQLRSERHRDPAALLGALETLPDVLRVATNEEVLFRQMVHTILGGVPLASAAAVVSFDSDEGQVRVRYHQQRLKLNGTEKNFAPSRKLVKRSLIEQKQSVVYVWEKGDPSDAGNSGMTIGAHFSASGYPWAICTPFQDESGLGLYVDGVMDHPPQVKLGKVDDTLRDYLKLIELIASLIEATMKAHGMERSLSVLRGFLPRRLVNNIRDPRRLEEILKPSVANVTVLFCDIRGSCQIAESGRADLEQTWHKVSAALDDMTQVITTNDGIVAGFQGDAVMAFWGWPDHQPDQTLKAAQTALRIRERFDTQGWYRDFSCGIGLAHGPAMAGRLGAHDLAKVDVFGPIVNLASRLESMTKQFGVRILIEESVAAGLREAGPSRMIGRIRQLGRFRPAGMDNLVNGVMISELMPKVGEIGGDMSEAVRRMWEEMVRMFLAGEWPRTRLRLAQFFSEDKAGQKLIDYIDTHGPLPPEGWDGVIPLDTK